MRITVNLIVASFTIALFENVQEEPRGFHVVFDLLHLRISSQMGPSDPGPSA